MTREELIGLCEAATVPQAKWRNRDSASAQRQVGEAWALLRAGCEFVIDTDMNDAGGQTVWLRITSDGFNHFEMGEGHEDNDLFYLPSRARLDHADGTDWY